MKQPGRSIDFPGRFYFASGTLTFYGAPYGVSSITSGTPSPSVSVMPNSRGFTISGPL